MEQKVKRREWVKTAAIVFLSVLLILTFFSNTIMNRSLPEVATQVVQSGSINAQIRGNGTISAEETYDVTISQSRKVQSVKARVGDEVKTGDVLFVLDPAESSELQAARDTLASMELAYQQSMITASNAAAQENRSIQKLRDSYNEALAAYQMYSNMDPTKLNTQLAAANATLKSLNRDWEDAQEAVTNAQSDENYLENKAKVDSLKSQIDSLVEQMNNYDDQIKELQAGGSTSSAQKQKQEAEQQIVIAQNNQARDKLIYQDTYDSLQKFSLFFELYQEDNQNSNPRDTIPSSTSYSGLNEDKKASVDTRMAAYAEQPSLLNRNVSELNSQLILSISNHWHSLHALSEADIENLLETYEKWTDPELSETERDEYQEDVAILHEYATYIVLANKQKQIPESQEYEDLSAGVKTEVDEYLKKYSKEKDVSGFQSEINNYIVNPANFAFETWNLSFQEENLQNMSTAYEILTQDEKELKDAIENKKYLETELSNEDSISRLKTKKEETQEDLRTARQSYNVIQPVVEYSENRIEQLKTIAKQLQQKVDDQQDVVNRMQDAQSAASALTSAKEALEDALFELSLGDTDALRLQKDKEDIEKQKTLITELEEKSDAVEVKARVSGVISAVNITAGNTANAETPLATITIKDRGYTVRISCTADQSRRVTIGDQAKLSNYYSGGVTATLEKIIPDPQNPQTGRFLVFRLTGEGVQPGSNVTLAIGQKSATYEALIPNSALRSDTNGNYVLVVVEKSNALSTRYTARRVDVTVLASDDTQTAVVGLSPGDFVITTSNRPIEAGAQVRLPDAS